MTADGPPPAHSADVSIWLIDLPADAPSDCLSRCATLLDPTETAAATCFRVESALRQYVIAHAAMRLMLSAFIPAVPPSTWAFSRGRFGKPRITCGGPRFNLSHTHGLVACAVSTAGEIGIDVEARDRPIDLASMSAVLSEAEIRELTSLDSTVQSERFFDLWTAKEAYAKACGRGISEDLKGVTVRASPDPAGVVRGTVNEWFLHQFVTGRFVVALATATPCTLSVCRLSVEALTARIRA